MTPAVALYKHSPSLFGTKEDWIPIIIANLVGSCIFSGLTGSYLRVKQLKNGRFLKNYCYDCGRVDYVRRLVVAPGGYDRTTDRQPQYRCKECSEKNWHNFENLKNCNLRARVSYSGYYATLPRLRGGFDSRYPLHLTTPFGLRWIELQIRYYYSE